MNIPTSNALEIEEAERRANDEREHDARLEKTARSSSVRISGWTEKPSSELNDLFELAEKIQSRCESLEQTLFWFRIGGPVSVIAFAAFMFTSIPHGHYPVFAARILFVFLLGSTIYLSVMIARTILVLGRRIKREKRALAGVVEILREIEQSMKFTPLGRAKMRLRLSRFDITRSQPEEKATAHPG